MSHSSAPNPGATPVPTDAMYRDARAKLASALRRIEDGIDRIDPPNDDEQILLSNAPYLETQLMHIGTAFDEAIVMLHMMKFLGAFAVPGESLPPADAERILDELDDVILPCEGGAE